jgi:hypothetical protein
MTITLRVPQTKNNSSKDHIHEWNLKKRECSICHTNLDKMLDKLNADMIKYLKSKEYHQRVRELERSCGRIHGNRYFT